jgi:hypothetical protein
MGEDVESLAMKASSSSFPDVVESDGVVMCVLAADKLEDTLASVVTLLQDCTAENNSSPTTRSVRRMLGTFPRCAWLLRFCA